MENSTAEKLLIQRILGGDLSLFSQLVENHHLKVRSYIFKRCSNSADAEDITQEIFIAAYKNLSQYNDSKPFSAWIFGIARNKSNEYFRKLKRLPQEAHYDEISDGRHTDSPDVLISTEEKSQCFWAEAKRLLSEEQYAAVWLRYQSDLNVAEISQALEISLSNTKIHLFRARKKLITSKLIHQLNL